jgi:hypothetical protein
MFSTPSYAEWTKVSESGSGNNFYVDFERIKKQGRYIYFWQLSDYFRPTPTGRLSGKTYRQGDCKLLRIKLLSDQYYNEPMGRGEIASYSNIPDENWRYPSPNSSNETTLEVVCSFVR